MISQDRRALQRIIEKIQNGETPTNSDVLPFLIMEPKADRCEANSQLARAYFNQYQKQGDRQSLSWARSCVERAWLLSQYSSDILPLFIAINDALKDIASIQEVLKQGGLALAARGDIGGALQMFDRWAYANLTYTGADTHNYDPEVIACVERMSSIYRFDIPSRPENLQDRKIRLAYLMHGLPDAGSVQVNIDRVFARYHDKSRFDVAYFATNNKASIAASSHAQAAIDDLQNYNCPVHVAPNEGALHQQLLSLGETIHEFKPDILITAAGLASFNYYFVASLRPAPVTIAFHQGPSPQFSWHSFDHSISWYFTNIVDCPTDCSHVPLETELPTREGTQPASKASLGIPENAKLIASGGRWPKFQNPEFWQAMAEILRENEDVHWMIIGVREEQVPFLPGTASGQERQRIHFLGWRLDYVQLLAAADLLIDSYPVGGAVLLEEAMALGLPVISFVHDYLSAYSNNDSSGGSEIVGIPELLVPRGDFDKLKSLTSLMLNDKEYRLRMAARCNEVVLRTRGNPTRMVRRCEEIYQETLKRLWSKGKLVDERLVPGESFPSWDPSASERAMLIEQNEILNRREAAVRNRESAIKTRDALHNSIRLYRLERGLRRRFSRLKEKLHLDKAGKDHA